MLKPSILVCIVCLVGNYLTEAQSSTSKTNSCPLIGVLVQNITDKGLLEQAPDLKGKSYIAASYIKWLEGAGARVVAFHPDMPEKKIQRLFDSVSGLLFPGGEINLKDSGYATLGKKLYDKAKKVNNDGVPFPVFGICRGMQAMAVFEEGNLSSLVPTDSRNYTTSVHYTLDMINSPFLKDMEVPLMAAVEAYNVTSHFHKYGIPPTAMEKETLKKTYKTLGTSKDRKGKEFVSIMQGVDLPFFGVQFHPEKPAFEWADNVNIPHDPQAICFGQYLANKFIEEARKNTKHTFESYEAESKASVYGDKLMDVSLYAPKCHTPLQQIYVYDNKY